MGTSRPVAGGQLRAAPVAGRGGSVAGVGQAAR